VDEMLTVKEVSELSGIHSDTISKYISGAREPRLKAELGHGDDGRVRNYFKREVVEAWVNELKRRKLTEKRGRKNKVMPTY